MAGTLAIDLGSTTTVVAWQEDRGNPVLLPLPPYSAGDPPVVPSLIWQSHPDHLQPLLGRQVLEAGLADTPGPGLCRDFKRSIGAPVPLGEPGSGQEEPPSPKPWLSPEEAGAVLLRRIWEALPADLEPHRLILTAPVEAYGGYRRWLQEVSQALPVAEIALVDEPTAAAIGCGLSPGSKVLVVDFGGGTLDLSLVALEGGEGRSAPVAQLLRFAGRDLLQSGQRLRTAKVLGKAGVPLGGRDLDRWIAEALCPGHPPSGELLAAAESLKCTLSAQEEAYHVLTPSTGGPLELRLSRARFEGLLMERGLGTVLEELLEAMGAAARRHGLELSQLDAVLPVGGSSRIPWLRRLLQEACPKVPLRDERPVEAIAMGALALTPGVQVKDVLSRGVSLRCWDQRSRSHLWHPLFQAGQLWPTAQPLELVLACSEEQQGHLELTFGEPLPQERAEVVFENGVPVIRRRREGSAAMGPWSDAPQHLILSPPGVAGVDRVRLRFSINGRAELEMEGEDVLAGTPLPKLVLGTVR
ncbi:MAG: Hsp70 family protein [Cyanobacteriota bacterium]|nr:Hsp70 family protein [Cyanobacteriota bacterium]